MGIFDFDIGNVHKTPKRKKAESLTPYHKARKPLKKYVPLYGGSTTLAGTPLTKSQNVQRTKARRGELKKHKRQVRRIYRRLI